MLSHLQNLLYFTLLINSIDSDSSNVSADEDIQKIRIKKSDQFRCNLCLDVFVSKAVLVKHWRNKHSKVKLFHCKICNKEFSDAFSCRNVVYMVFYYLPDPLCIIV